MRGHLLGDFEPAAVLEVGGDAGGPGDQSKSRNLPRSAPVHPGAGIRAAGARYDLGHSSAGREQSPEWSSLEVQRQQAHQVCRQAEPRGSGEANEAKGRKVAGRCRFGQTTKAYTCVGVRPSRRLAKRIVRPISLIPITEHKGRYVVVVGVTTPNVKMYDSVRPSRRLAKHIVYHQ